MGDPEIDAMTAVSTAIEKLDPAAQRRVLAWASERFVPGAGFRAPAGPAAASRETANPAAFEEFVDLFHAANPRTDGERALVAGYWFQQVQGNNQLRAQDLNTALKSLGHGLSNITDALRSSEQHKPAYVRQTTKSGRTQQARKTYKLTLEGIARVEKLVIEPASERGEGLVEAHRVTT